tara:strand:- start:1036 stop:1287 length:252 start_codon:yes stop_codon:yes gene_type:complete
MVRGHKPYEPSVGDKVTYHKGTTFEFVGEVIRKGVDTIMIRYKRGYDMPKRTERLKGRALIDVFDPSNIRWGNSHYWITPQPR